MTRKFTGWHMTAILVMFFGTVMAVNFTMAAYASSTFGGIVVENSYVASQKYNDWLDAAKDQQALRWKMVATRRPDGRVLVMAQGPGTAARLTAVARHPLGRAPDRELDFVRQADGSFVSGEALPVDRWTLRYQFDDGDRNWRHEAELR